MKIQGKLLFGLFLIIFLFGCYSKTKVVEINIMDEGAEAELFAFDYLKNINFSGTNEELITCAHINNVLGTYKSSKINNDTILVEWLCSYYKTTCSACVYQNKTVKVLPCSTMRINNPKC